MPRCSAPSDPLNVSLPQREVLFLLAGDLPVAAIGAAPS